MFDKNYEESAYEFWYLPREYDTQSCYTRDWIYIASWEHEIRDKWDFNSIINSQTQAIIGKTLNYIENSVD